MPVHDYIPFSAQPRPCMFPGRKHTLRHAAMRELLGSKSQWYPWDICQLSVLGSTEYELLPWDATLSVYSCWTAWIMAIDVWGPLSKMIFGNQHLDVSKDRYKIQTRVIPVGTGSSTSTVTIVLDKLFISYAILSYLRAKNLLQFVLKILGPFTCLMDISSPRWRPIFCSTKAILNVAAKLQ